MQLFIIKPNGQFGGELNGTADEILPQIPPDCSTTGIIPPRNTDYWNGSSWVDIGKPPAYYMVFDYDVKSWKDMRDLEETKKAKWQEIKLQRNAKEQGGFEFEGNMYDSDHISQVRILGAVMLGAPTTWTLQNDTVIGLDADKLKELGQALANHIQALHERARSARQLIDECESVSQVDAIIF